MAKRRRKPDGTIAEIADSLGELVDRYHVSLAGALIVSGAVAVVGLGLVVYARIRQPSSLIFLLIGGFVLLAARSGPVPASPEPRLPPPDLTGLLSCPFTARRRRRSPPRRP